MKLWYTTGDVAVLRELPRDRVVCLDVETTGLDPRFDEVLQLAFVRGDGKVLMSHYVRPIRHTSWPAAQRVHGISPSTVERCPFLTLLAPSIEGAFAEADLIVGYNVVFDLAFFRAAGISCGHAPVFDVMREFAPVAGRWDVTRRRYAWVPLSHCAQFYEISFRAHDALEDARTTLDCFWAMLERRPKSRGPMTRYPSSAQSYLDLANRYAKERGCEGDGRGQHAL